MTWGEVGHWVSLFRKPVPAFGDVSSLPPSPRLQRGNDNSILAIYWSSAQNPPLGYVESLDFLKATD
jgi:hypothetical protein